MNGFKAQDDETIQEMSPADGAKETAPELGAIERVLLELENLKIGQTRIYNQVINARQDVEAVSDYIMLKDANWDLDGLRALKETYDNARNGKPPEAKPKDKMKGVGKSDRVA